VPRCVHQAVTLIHAGPTGPRASRRAHALPGPKSVAGRWLLSATCCARSGWAAVRPKAAPWVAGLTSGTKVAYGAARRMGAIRAVGANLNPAPRTFGASGPVGGFSAFVGRSSAAIGAQNRPCIPMAYDLSDFSQLSQRVCRGDPRSRRKTGPRRFAQMISAARRHAGKCLSQLPIRVCAIPATRCRARRVSASPARPAARTSRNSRYPPPHAVHWRRRPSRPDGLSAIRATRRHAGPASASPANPTGWTFRNSRHPLSRTPRVGIARQSVRMDFPQFALLAAAHSPRRRRPPARPHGLPAIRAIRCRALPRSALPASPTARTSRSSRYPLPCAPRVGVARQSGRMDFPQFALPVAARSPRRRRPPARPHGLPAIRATRCRARRASASPANPGARTFRSSRYRLPRRARRHHPPVRPHDFPQFALPVAHALPAPASPPSPAARTSRNPDPAS